MTADDNTGQQVTFALKMFLKRSPFVVKYLDERRGVDLFEEIARRQAKAVLGRRTLKKPPPLRGVKRGAP